MNSLLYALLQQQAVTGRGNARQADGSRVGLSYVQLLLQSKAPIRLRVVQSLQDDGVGIVGCLDAASIDLGVPELVI